MVKTRVAGPGPQASSKGTPINNGKALQVVTYPRERAKAVLVEYSRKCSQSLSAFLLIAGLEKAAKMKELATGRLYKAEDLIPEDEYAELLRMRGGKGKRGGKAAG